LTAFRFVSIIELIMNTESLIPLVATISYIPLFVILLTNRPWQRQQRLFFLFLIPAMLWSLSDTVGRSDFFMQDKLLLVKIVLCAGVWMAIQYRYLLQSFYKSDVARIPFVYVILAASIALAALGYIPRDIAVTTSGIDVDYGAWLLVVSAILLIIFRRALMYLGLYGGGLAIVLLFFLVAHMLFGFKPDFTTLALAIGLGIPVIVFLIHRARDFLQTKLEEAFIGARYSYRRQLSEFITGIYDVPTLQELGSDFISLLAQSLDCRRACLLLPQAEDGGFGVRFIYPPVKDNPMRELKLRQDSPVVTWLERESTVLQERNLTIFPEFQSIWQEEREEIQLAGVNTFVPLMNKGKLVAVLAISERRRNIGSLILASRKPNAYSDRQIRLLEKVALQIAAPVENAQLYAQVEQKSRVDEITGLFNRQHFEERLKEEISRHARYGDVFSIFMLDLDNFKTYNDVYGHPAGDSLLSQVGKITKSSVRDADQAFRYGGDEFIVILPQTARDDAYVVAERVRDQVAAEMEKKSLTVTCSIGLASYPADGVISEDLVTVADTALYYAKWTGGNRTYLSSKVLSEPVDNGEVHGKRNGLSAVYSLVSVVEARDPYVYGHSRKVNTYAVALAEAIGLSPEEVSRVSTAALLHDIGKIGVPDKVLNKKGKLNAEDWEAIKSHPRLGAIIVGNIPNLAPCVSTILHHHERWDGSGYPEGLKGEQIPIEARILAIADSFEAMSSARPYRPALCGEKVLKELRRGAGSQFDPELVEVFIGIVEAGLPEEARAGQNPPGELPDSKPSIIGPMPRS